jgi:hypothetical protein
MTTATPEQITEGIARRFAADKWVAHEALFAHRHGAKFADFHPEIVADFWSDDPYSQVIGFRGCAKSTLGEEDIVLAAVFGAYRNIVIVGSSETRAVDRLASVKNELAHNELITMVFGGQVGEPWQATKIVTKNGVCIQAIGRDQDIRGIKHLDWRPDFVFVDDFESRDDVQTPEGRRKTLRWFLSELLPACAPARKVRVRATPMDAESVPMRLMNDLKNESRWPTKIFPIERIDAEGNRTPTWPAAYPRAWIDAEHEICRRLGELGVWAREYMCEAVSDADRDFHPAMMRVRPRTPGFEAVYAMIDPARTTTRDSATTGWAVWSWIANRLVVWAAGAANLKPDQIIELMFTIADEYDPVMIGIEKTGLNEFLMQPIRHEQARRGRVIPYKGIEAPRGKLDFIRALQPYFANDEVEFAQELPELRTQLLSFPRGHIDAPNALAYALPLRPGLPVYEAFDQDHIADDLVALAGRTLFVAANAGQGLVAAALIQVDAGQTRILADWVLEGTPAERVGEIHMEAAIAGDSHNVERRRLPADLADMLKNPNARMTLARLPIKWVTPPRHKDRWNNVGLNQAIARIPAGCSAGVDAALGRAHLADAFARLARNAPAVLVSTAATWTCRALSGGYARALDKTTGRPSAEAEDGPYKLLMEGIESFAGMMAAAEDDAEDDENQNYSFDRQGRRYKSAMPAR